MLGTHELLLVTHPSQAAHAAFLLEMHRKEKLMVSLQSKDSVGGFERKQETCRMQTAGLRAQHLSSRVTRTVLTISWRNEAGPA